VREVLASGGMGVVYRVFDQVAGEERAMKRVRPDVKGEPFYEQALEREYHVLARLDHPRIIRVFDHGLDDLGPYYTMELLSGRDLRQVAPLPYREACSVLRDVATSLALLHARRLIHRDLSPGNVRVTPDGHCKLLDFGTLAAFGTADVVVGTPPGVPPEAFGRAPLDQRSDLYALGALAYWILTARHAYPARRLEDLPDLWTTTPPPPSASAPDVPKELDALVQRLLSMDPRARPASAADVIARLTAIGELADEGTTETRRLALSFLTNPRFVGRKEVLERVRALSQAAARGRGGCVWIEAIAGMGRTRVLEEIGVSAQADGATVVHVDAGMVRQTRGTARALVLRLVDSLPQVARNPAPRFEAALASLGRDVRGLFGARPSTPPAVDPGGDRPLEEWFGEVSLERPVVVLVDNVECADDASLGLLAGLTKVAADRRLMVVVTECSSRETSQSIGLATLREHASVIELAGLGAHEMRELGRSLFGDAPGVERFTEWLRERTAGSPLHAIEVSRQLLTRGVIGYSAGVWTLPDQVPDAELPAALGDALSMRLALLSDPARGLAECLSLQRDQPTFELCALLAEPAEGGGVLSLLDELAEREVLYFEQDGYRFSSVALQDALLAGMDDARLERNHRRLGESFAKLADDDKLGLRIEAGWHLIQGGDELRGADLIAAVTYDAVNSRELLANLHRIGRALEAALEVYGRYRRSQYERLPLLASLAQAGYYEDRSWGERYGDEALYVAEDLSGLGTARRLRRFSGGWIALVLGILSAWLRFRIAPPHDRRYPFAQVYMNLFATVTTLAGLSSLSFDGEHAERVADVLEPFSVLPKRRTPVGIYDFCRGMREIARENEAAAYERFDELLGRFQDPRYYSTLPADARRFYVAGAHYVRGTLAIFRADGRGALESADALDRMGLKLYAMIASQLRCLFWTMRGEFGKAAIHREQVEIHAAHVGSAWQVETWEAAALLLVYPQMGDVVGSTRLAHRLERLSKAVPSMKLYGALARDGLLLSRGEPSNRPAIARVIAKYEGQVPRSYVGWAGAMGYVARGYNLGGEHAKAKSICEGALAHVCAADREYVMHFLSLELELAAADAALGHHGEALQRLDGLLERYDGCDHRLAIGLLHEARATIAWGAGQTTEYARSLREVERCFLSSEEPALVAKYKRLVALGARSEALGQNDTSAVLPAGSSAGASVSTPEQLARTAVAGPRSVKAFT
jgi:hypothetical protein